MLHNIRSCGLLDACQKLLSFCCPFAVLSTARKCAPARQNTRLLDAGQKLLSFCCPFAALSTARKCCCRWPWTPCLPGLPAGFAMARLKRSGKGVALVEVQYDLFLPPEGTYHYPGAARRHKLKFRFNCTTSRSCETTAPKKQVPMEYRSISLSCECGKVPKFVTPPALTADHQLLIYWRCTRCRREVYFLKPLSDCWWACPAGTVGKSDVETSPADQRFLRSIGIKNPNE